MDLKFNQILVGYSHKIYAAPSLAYLVSIVDQTVCSWVYGVCVCGERARERKRKGNEHAYALTCMWKPEDNFMVPILFPSLSGFCSLNSKGLDLSQRGKIIL